MKLRLHELLVDLNRRTKPVTKDQIYILGKDYKNKDILLDKLVQDKNVKLENNLYSITIDGKYFLKSGGYIPNYLQKIKRWLLKGDNFWKIINLFIGFGTGWIIGFFNLAHKAIHIFHIL